jgi:hypothetical protein
LLFECEGGGTTLLPDAYKLKKMVTVEMFRDFKFGSSLFPRMVPITVAAASARSNTGIVGSNPTQGKVICVRLFSVCVVLCVSSGLAIPPPRSRTDCVKYEETEIAVKAQQWAVEPYTDYFSYVSRPQREADHSPPTSAEVKKMWIYTSTPIRLHGVVLN